MPAKDVKAYVKRNKNDAADADAISRSLLLRRLLNPISTACFTLLTTLQPFAGAKKAPPRRG